MSDEVLDYYGRLWKNQFHPHNSGDLFLVPKENYIELGDLGTTHKSPHDYDTHVPLVFAGYGLTPKVVTDSVETVDIAPTIARLLGIPVPDRVDGKILRY